MPFETGERLASPTGADLNLRVQPAEGPGVGVVQINHGLAEHSARYSRLARMLGGRGFHVYAHDHRGHGFTTAPGAPQGSFGADVATDLVIGDVLSVHDLIAHRHPGLPVTVFGHSMGGMIALNFVLRHPGRIAGAAIWNARLSPGAAGRAARLLLAWERFRLGSDMPSRLLPNLTFGAWAKTVPDRRTEFDWLSRDPAEVDAYVADPLCGWDASVGMWRTVFDLMFSGADDGRFASVPRTLPFHLVGGADDPATGGGRAVEQLAARLRRMGFSNLVSTVYAETRHESLNEVNRDVIMADFAGWLEKGIKSLENPS